MQKNGSGCSVRSSDVERGTHIEPPLYADFGVHTTIGEDTFINVNCMIVDDAAISIGKRVLIGPAVQLIAAMHPLRVAERRTAAADVAAGAVVTRNGPPDSLAAGTPAKVIRDLR